MGKIIIVTGGCGYIGSHIARAFKWADHTNYVYIIDRVKRDHTLKHIDGYLIDDFASQAALEEIARLKPDVVIHCAGTSLVGPSVVNPAEYYINNVSKTTVLMNALRMLEKKPSIIFSSSASVYGEPECLPIPEDHPVGAITPYGNTKLLTEVMLDDFSFAYGLTSTCFRFFNVAGAWPLEYNLGEEPDGTHIIARALEASINGRAFNIYGDDYDTPDGTCVRDYIHVMDVAAAHIKAVNYMTANPGHHVFNLGSGQGVSNRAIAEYIDAKYGFKFLNYTLPRAGDPAMLVADIDLAQEELGWEPEHSDIDNIIDSAYQWYITNAKSVDNGV